MNRIPVESEEYQKVMNAYFSLIEKSILREKKKEFIGGMPINLTRKHIFNLVSTSRKYNSYSKYTVTTKVDGVRMFMFICDPDPKNEGRRRVHFIDRSLNLFTASNKEKRTIPSLKSPVMLIDGEAVFFNNKKTKDTMNPMDTELISFMAFDILYGPTNIFPTSGGGIEYDQTNSMIGPMGGKMWDYGRRLNLLNKLITPSVENLNNPPLSMQLCKNSFFRVELKKIEYISAIPDGIDIVNFVNSEFENYRFSYFDRMSALGCDQRVNNKYKDVNIKFDGLIFTPIDTEYVVGNWVKFRNTQYKWKPEIDQTIDFSIFNTGRTKVLDGSVERYNIVKLKVGNGNFFSFRGVDTGLIKSTINFSDGDIAEFSYNPEINMFIFNRFRPDKNRPNAFLTARSVIDSISFPVDINVISGLYRGDKKIISETAVSYLDKKQINRLLSCTETIDVITSGAITNILSYIGQLKTESDMELEVRVGKIDKNFITDVPVQLFKNTHELFNIMGWTMSNSTYLDSFDKFSNVRTRYKFVPEINQFIEVQTIIKERINTTDINLNLISDFDIRVALSRERKVNTVSAIDARNKMLHKIRTRYIDPNGIILVDLTEVKSVKMIENNITLDNSVKLNIEFEINNVKEIVDSELLKSIINMITYYVNEIEQNWN